MRVLDLLPNLIKCRECEVHSKPEEVLVRVEDCVGDVVLLLLELFQTGVVYLAGIVHFGVLPGHAKVALEGLALL